jgi:hypothetical protein
MTGACTVTHARDEEHALRGPGATIIRVGGPLTTERLTVNQEHRGILRAEADKADADKRLAAHRERLAAEIAAAAPLLTAEQREMLRPILAGTIPANAIEADQATA